MKAGDLRHPVTLQQKVMVLNEKGRRIPDWQDAAIVYAHKADVSGREFYAAHAVHAEDVVTFTIRWRPGIDTTWRLVHHGIPYDILEVNHLGYMGDYMRLKCRVVQGEK